MRHIHIVFLNNDFDAFSHDHLVEVLFYCKQSRRSAIVPDSALAATVNGLAKNTFASGFPRNDLEAGIVIGHEAHPGGLFQIDPSAAISLPAC